MISAVLSYDGQPADEKLLAIGIEPTDLVHLMTQRKPILINVVELGVCIVIVFGDDGDQNRDKFNGIVELHRSREGR